MSELKDVGSVPGNEIEVIGVSGASKSVEVRGPKGSSQLPPIIAHAVMVRRR